MTPDQFLRIAVDPALSLLPDRMRSDEARAMLVAIALQESGLTHRRQIGAEIPALGLHQFESPRHGRVAIVGLLEHGAVGEHAARVAGWLGYPASPYILHSAVEDNDVLGCVLARLLLWTVPRPLSLRGDAEGSWRYYLDGWRPGAPRPEKWPGNYERAWAAVDPFPAGATT